MTQSNAGLHNFNNTVISPLRQKKVVNTAHFDINSIWIIPN